MTLVVVGIDALDADLVSEETHPNLTLENHREISTLRSSNGELSTHELWPTIITGLSPKQHGLTLNSGLNWESSIIQYGAEIAKYTLPGSVRSRIGAWILNNANVDVFQTPVSYYDQRGLSTLFDGAVSKAIGIPNYVTDSEGRDREHELRRGMGDLFERDADRPGGHASSDPVMFYERCMEMVMIRLARIRRALRSRRYELVFGYTSGLDLIGHVVYNDPELQGQAYAEIDEFVGELRSDLDENDNLVLISDHGLREGMHTEAAMIASLESGIVEEVSSVLEVREALERELEDTDHRPQKKGPTSASSGADEAAVREHLQNLGYI